MIVYLYRVGRNLNRAYRTCEAFGVRDMRLIDCNGASVQGNLFAACGQVDVTQSAMPQSSGLVLLETTARMPITSVDWTGVEAILVGGESTTLPNTIPAEQRAVIPMRGRVSGLTVEAALAIALHEWRRSTC